MGPFQSATALVVEEIRQHDRRRSTVPGVPADGTDEHAGENRLAGPASVSQLPAFIRDDISTRADVLPDRSRRLRVRADQHAFREEEDLEEAGLA